MFSPHWRSEFESKDFNKKVSEAIAISLQHTHMVFHTIKGCYFQEFVENTPNVPSYSISGTEIHWYQNIPEYNAQVYVVAEYGEPLVLAHDCGKEAFYILKCRWFGFYSTVERKKASYNLIVIGDKILVKMLHDAISPLEFPWELRGDGFVSNKEERVVAYCPVSKTIFVPYQDSHSLSGNYYLYKKIDGFLPFDINPFIRPDELRDVLQSVLDDEQILHYELTEEEIVKYS